MICATTTLFSMAVWFLITKLILSVFGKPISPAAMTYLVVSTIAVAMTTFLAVVLAVAVIE